MRPKPPCWRFLCLAVLIVGTLLSSNFFFTQAAPSAPLTDLSIYDDNLGSGWQNWSWDGSYNFNDSTTVHSGSSAIAVTYTAAWAGLRVHHAGINSTSYSDLQFWLHGGSTGGQAVRVYLNDTEPAVSLTPTADTWQQITLPLTSFGSPTQITDITWQDEGGNLTTPIFYLDDIRLLGSATPLSLSVDANANQHAISPNIYGMNFADEALADELQLPVHRWGGNHTSRYNWQNSMTNLGSDWYFQNYPQGSGNPANLPDDSATDLFIEQNGRTGTDTLLTVPTIGWSATPRREDHPFDCGFSQAKYGSQQDFDPFDPDCGNGILSDGTAVTGNDPFDTSTGITPGFVTEWMAHLANKYGTAADGGVRFYALDNEPMLWNETHRDVHPQATSYDEMRDLAYAYGAAIKTADPQAQIVGPVLFGWTAYWFSALDWEPGGNWWENPQDRNAHGGTPFAPWYLQQMAAYEQSNGTRILDYFDLHYYPQAEGVSLSPAGSATTQVLRLRSTRSLWDPTYADESWINGTEGGPAVRLIPRMQEWVDTNYPGTKLAISEYNWGALDHINGALAQADVLGIFGRERLDLAALWDPPAADEPGAFAFRLYRNYDGTGSQFGTVSVEASSSDQGQLAIYAARRSSDGALTMMIINKTAEALTSEVALTNFTPQPMAQVYRYSAANLKAIVQEADQVVTAGGFTGIFPAHSITLVVVGTAVVADHFTYLPMIIR
jgi:hypothetical protein